jgi:hypothetical protein
MPHVYIVREPFGGFEKGMVLTQAQIDATASDRHLDHHTVRIWRADPKPAAVITTGNADPSPQPSAVITMGNGEPVSPPPPPPTEPPPLSPPASDGEAA